jgi:hypothetical protein
MTLAVEATLHQKLGGSLRGRLEMIVATSALRFVAASPGRHDQWFPQAICGHN